MSSKKNSDDGRPRGITGFLNQGDHRSVNVLQQLTNSSYWISNSTLNALTIDGHKIFYVNDRGGEEAKAQNVEKDLTNKSDFLEQN